MIFNFLKRNKKDNLHIFDTLKRERLIFEPLQKGKVKIYSCGPTVYDRPHIGNMRYFIFVDTLHRALKEAGYDIKHVINITDVGHLTDDADSGEDKIEKAARKHKKSAQEIVDENTKYFFDDLKFLSFNLDEYIFPKATDYIQEQILFVKSLEEKGYTYKTKDGIYFDTGKFKEYGKLGNIDIENIRGGARVELAEKKNKTDFALWKFSPKDANRQQEWDSPWGKGFPGWHIECSAMIKSILGKSIDIHTGGIDHIPVHHNNEIAQSESLNNVVLAKYWMHSAFLLIDNEKISKSKGNTLSLDDLKEKGFKASHFRYFVLGAHYRKELHFSFEALQSAKNAHEKLLRFAQKFKKENIQNDPKSKYVEQFKEKIFDDLSTPEALAVLWDMLKDDKLEDAEKINHLIYFDRFLAISLFDESLFEKEIDMSELPDEVQTIVRERTKARQEKNYQKADLLRDKLNSLGYKIVDSKDGAKVYKK